MNKVKRLKQWLTLLLIPVLLAGCEQYAEYIPVEQQGDQLVENKALLTEKHRENIKRVFDYYNVKWKEEEGKLLVASGTDKELLWNYTTKANDPRWMKEHVRTADKKEAQDLYQKALEAEENNEYQKAREYYEQSLELHEDSLVRKAYLKFMATIGPQ